MGLGCCLSVLMAFFCLVSIKFIFFLFNVFNKLLRKILLFFFKKKQSRRKMAMQCNMLMLLNSISQHMKTCLLHEKTTHLIKPSFP